MVCTDLITQIMMRVLPLPANKSHLLKDYLPDSEYTVRNSIKKNDRLVSTNTNTRLRRHFVHIKKVRPALKSDEARSTPVHGAIGSRDQ